MSIFVGQKFVTVGVSGFKLPAVIGERVSCTFVANALLAGNALT
jgi:hypothetical protein